MHVLVVSPIPSHPQQQGNSERIYRLCRLLQSLGHVVHFLYYALEGITESTRKAMTECWDFFYYVHPTIRTDIKSAGDVFGLDDWYEFAVSEMVAQLNQRWRFHCCIVNYVWQSKVLEALPPTVLKIIDTHDIFGDRKNRAVELGMEPSWFYTTVEEERRGLLRADMVLAIQDEEARYFRSLGLPDVKVVGHAPPARYLVPRKYAAPLQVGYLASANPWNVQSFLALQDKLKSRQSLLRSCEFFVAGAICRAIRTRAAPFRSLGLIPEVESFYRRADVVLNPMIGGTGLKIKTIEALSFGRPVIATRDGMKGIPAVKDYHLCDGVDRMLDVVAQFTQAPDRLAGARQDSIDLFEQYRAACVNALAFLRPEALQLFASQRKPKLVRAPA